MLQLQDDAWEARMIEGQQFAVSGLVKEIYRTKALIKYEIKQLESRLQKIMSDGKHASLKSQDAAKYCTELIAWYGNLLELEAPSYLEETVISSSYENTLTRCYVKIQRLRLQFSKALTRTDKLKTVVELRHGYNCLQAKLNVFDSESQTADHINNSLSLRKKELFEAKNPAEWLAMIVSFASDAGENIVNVLTFFRQLNDMELLYLADLFGQDDFVLYINSIFFYKLNPQQLFDHSPHLEKLVSVRKRLSTLHRFIELIHQTIMQSLKDRGIQEGHDYLFHGNELPEGITLKIDKDRRDLIIRVIKDWRSPMLENADLINKNRLDDLFRVYKFWFNPNRLIDTVLILQCQLVGMELEDNCKKFSQQMKLLYQQLSTTECLELYGNFANKDSCYLMRTLAAAIQGQAISSLPVLNQVEREAVDKVYQALDCVMEGIREELFNRQITTAAYLRNLNAKHIKPRRRNFNALVRIIKLYCNQTIPMNQTIEQLFNEVERN